MAARSEIYFCELCGNLIEAIGNGSGELVCCGEPMVLKVAKTADSSVEKHVPVVTPKGSGSLIKVGSVPHPMEEKHYICWVEIINGDYVNRKYLKPGQAPEAEFFVQVKPGMVVREYCNIHGLWENKI